jgi:lysophospholipase L1-like esterase
MRPVNRIIVERFPEAERAAKMVLTTIMLLIMGLSIDLYRDAEVRIFLIGDSTMADKPLADNPERGWGQMLPMFFDDRVAIDNYAKNGRSTKSFIDQGLWQAVLNQLKEGDYVFIQFGHNDEKKEDSTRYAAPQTTYKQNLLRFVRESREKGAIPVLITPVDRRKFDDNGKSFNTHGDYPAVVKEVAKGENAPLIDLQAEYEPLFDKLGPEGTKKIFLWVPPGKYRLLPDGKEDNTHFTQYGAIQIAGLVVEGIKGLNLPLKGFLKSDISVVGEGKEIGLDYYFNNEWKKDPDGKVHRFHYVWEDTESSGYSELGDILTNLDAGLTEITTAPADEDLNKLSIYIIVDPDTPLESPHPNYIDDKSIDVIVDWVKRGGVLALFANDSGNCEFAHLNKLAGNFGIHFNEDSRNHVAGKNYDDGAFTNFPKSAIFNGAKKIFLKEISTIKISGQAKAELVDEYSAKSGSASNGDIIMASAQFGKGFVFAVGDPWFYNEYMDNRKLPDGFDNREAAENLFAWLLQKAKPVSN